MLEVSYYDPEDDSWGTPFQVEFVSFLSPETYGPPALVAPSRDRDARAAVGESVHYIPTGAGAPPFSIKRVADR